jgi:hypothetical protein
MTTEVQTRTYLFMGQPDHEETFDRCRIYDGVGNGEKLPPRYHEPMRAGCLCPPDQPGRGVCLFRCEDCDRVEESR